MNIIYFKKRLVQIARSQTRFADVAHDIRHTLRVVSASEKIGKAENADLEILIPAALFHDAIVSPKNTPRARSDSAMSAEFSRNVLESFQGYPSAKIEYVCAAIATCSYKNGLPPQFLEAEILQDADRLDAIGAHGIMRAFVTCGHLRIPLYDENDPFCQSRKPNADAFGIDFFYSRILKVASQMHTKTGYHIARSRHMFVKKFLREIECELQQLDIKG